jgi:hypothetical protein
MYAKVLLFVCFTLLKLQIYIAYAIFCRNMMKKVNW